MFKNAVFGSLKKLNSLLKIILNRVTQDYSDLIFFTSAIFLKCLFVSLLLGVWITYMHASIGSILVFLCVAMLFKGKPRLIILLLVDFFITILILVDTLYYRYYGNIISFPVVMQQSGNIDPALLGSVKNLFYPYDLMLFLDFILIIILLIISNLRKANGSTRFYCIINNQNRHSIAMRFASFLITLISSILKRLRLHGLIKKVGKSYKYYLSALGKQVIVAGLSFKNMRLIPALATSL